jgi:hypothetical protein
VSRAINLALTEAQVASECAKAGISISAMEPLPAGGCHVVCVTGDGADEVRLRFQNHLIAGPVKRFPFYRPAGAL